MNRDRSRRGGGGGADAVDARTDDRRLRRDAFVAAIMDLGAVTTVDLSRLSPTTLRSMTAHVRLLQRNGVGLDRESIELEEPLAMLDRLRDRRGERLSDGYKRQILMTLKRMYPDLDLYRGDNKRFKKFTRHSVKSTRVSSDEFMEGMRRLLERAAQVVGSVYETGEIANLGTYDASVTALLAGSTSLRVHEILELRMRDAASIRADRAVGLKSKGSSRAFRAIALNDVLEATLTAIESQRDAVVRAVNDPMLSGSRYMSVEHQRRRLREDRLVISSEDHLRKKIRELAASIGVAHQRIGFNSFRSYITSVLTEGGGHLIAQSMNNHRSVDTTLDHYNVVTPAASERAYDDLRDIMDSILPPPSSTPPSTSTSEAQRRRSRRGERVRVVDPSTLYETPENSLFEAPIGDDGDDGFVASSAY